MNENVTKALNIWHKVFEDESKHYSEFESSDVEYFVGVIMYNLFGFSKAIPTMKTMDVGADFIQASNKTYVEVLELIDTIRNRMVDKKYSKNLREKIDEYK